MDWRRNEREQRRLERCRLQMGQQEKTLVLACWRMGEEGPPRVDHGANPRPARQRVFKIPPGNALVTIAETPPRAAYTGGRPPRY